MLFNHLRASFGPANRAGTGFAIKTYTETVRSLRNPSMKRTYLSPEALGSTDQTLDRLAALGEMSASIAHEIRNPLGSISLNLQYLSKKKEIPEVYQKNLRNIELGVARIRNVVEGILDSIRPSAPNIRRADIHSIIDSR